MLQGKEVFIQQLASDHDLNNIIVDESVGLAMRNEIADYLPPGIRKKK